MHHLTDSADTGRPNFSNEQSTGSRYSDDSCTVDLLFTNDWLELDVLAGERHFRAGYYNLNLQTVC